MGFYERGNSRGTSAQPIAADSKDEVRRTVEQRGVGILRRYYFCAARNSPMSDLRSVLGYLDPYLIFYNTIRVAFYNNKRSGSEARKLASLNKKPFDDR